VSRITAKFWEFHNANPKVYESLVKMARSLKRRGYEAYGMKGLFEVLRWEEATQSATVEEFKLDNNYTALYSRLIMKNVPELKNFFRTREISRQVI